MKRMAYGFFIGVALVCLLYSQTLASSFNGEEILDMEVDQDMVLKEFELLRAQGIFEGKNDGDPALNDRMTRAELAAVLIRMFDLQKIEGDPSFSDTNNHWAHEAGYIEGVYQAGLMNGTGNHQFSPTGYVTVEELAAVLVRGLGLKTSDTTIEDIPASEWAKSSIQAAKKAGFLPALSDYTLHVKRAHFIHFIFQAFRIAGDDIDSGIVAGSLEPKVTVKSLGDGDYELTFTIKNQTERVQEITFNSGQQFDYELYHNLEKVKHWSADKSFIQMVQTIELKQGEELTYTDKLEDLEDGSYRVVFWLTSDNFKDIKADAEFHVNSSLTQSLDYTVNNGDYTFTYEVKNTSNKPATLIFGSGQQFDYMLTDAKGSLVKRFSDDMAYTTAIEEVTLDPGESLSFDDTLKDLEEGTYSIQFMLTSMNYPLESGVIEFDIE